MKLNIDRKIKNGMWVVTVINAARRVGIINDVDLTKGECRLSLVGDDGVTTAHLAGEPLQGLEQAKFADIPEPRRGDPAVFARLGYV